MSSQFQNRLVGVTILVTSVVIFLPSIIDGKKSSYEDEFVSTPIRPALQEHTQSLANNKVEANNESGRADLPENETMQMTSVDDLAVENNQWEIQDVSEPVTIISTTEALAPEKSTVANTKKESQAKPVVKKSIVNKPIVKQPVKPKKVAVPDQAWVIQLGAFQNARNINTLLKKLHKAGFQAHTVPLEVIDGNLTRVFVGPDVSKKTLQKLLPQLKRLTKLQGKLIPFNAVNP